MAAGSGDVSAAQHRTIQYRLLYVQEFILKEEHLFPRSTSLYVLATIVPRQLAMRAFTLLRPMRICYEHMGGQVH